MNAVDGLGRFSPDLGVPPSDKSFNCPSGTPERRNSGVLPSSPRLRHKSSKSGKLSELFLSQQDSKMSSDCSSDETVIYVVDRRSSPNVIRTASKTSDEDDESSNKKSSPAIIEPVKCNATKAKLPEIYSAINSVSSQDSGINLSFHEGDARPVDLGRSGSTSSSSGSSSAESCGNNTNSRRPRNIPGIGRRVRVSTWPYDLSEDEIMREETGLTSDEEDDEAIGKLVVKNDEHESVESEIIPGTPQWHKPSEDIWKFTMEAIHEFNMIKDKDKILIYLPASVWALGFPPGKYSLVLLHALHHYRSYARTKGWDFEIGAVTVGAANNSYDPMELMSHLKALDVPYIYEETEQTALIPSDGLEQSEITSTHLNEHRPRCFGGIFTAELLHGIAKRYGYNVLALGQNLDDLAEGFLRTLFYTGRLSSLKAHVYLRDNNLRVIRPFAYVSETSLRQFVADKKLPNLRLTCEACQEAAAKVHFLNFYRD